jgi:hypothetical protein
MLWMQVDARPTITPSYLLTVSTSSSTKKLFAARDEANSRQRWRPQTAPPCWLAEAVYAVRCSGCYRQGRSMLRRGVCMW